MFILNLKKTKGIIHMAEHRLHLLLSILIASEIEKRMFCKLYIYIYLIWNLFRSAQWKDEEQRTQFRMGEFLFIGIFFFCMTLSKHYQTAQRLATSWSWEIFTALMNTSMGLLNGIWFSQCLNQLIHKGPFESVSFYDCVKFKGFQVHKMQRNGNQG